MRNTSEVHVRSRIHAVSVLAAGLLSTVACAGVIAVPNGSFESPTVPNSVPFASPNIGTWQKAAMPGWWLGMGQTASDWDNLAGVFLNVGGASGVEGSQAAFLFATPGMSLSQNLAETFEVGQEYHLTVAAEGGGYGMLPGVPLQIRLYYRDGANNPVVIGSATMLNTNASGELTQLTDFTYHMPAVQVGDPWAGEAIGIEIASPVDFANMGGYWDIDNVRLSSSPVPEPLVMGLFAPAACLMLVRYRRAG